MTHTAVPAHMPVQQPQPSPRARTARRSLAAVRRQAAEHERHRLGRELHDGVIQEILAAGLAIDRCLAELPAGSPARATLQDAGRLAGSALRRLRVLLQGLRADAAASGDELPELLRRLQRAHPAGRLEVTVQVTGAPVPLRPEIRCWLFQLASECVFNAALHGHARRAVITLDYRPGVVALCVADDGCGQPELLMKIIRDEVPGTGGGYHVGLSDIAAGTAQLGGTLHAGRSDLGGITIGVLLPVSPPGGARGAGDG
jgi:signal transduction histidine kinase